MQNPGGDPRSFAELLSGLLEDVSLLFNQHLALAKAEFGQMFTAVLLGLIILVVGAIVVSVGLVALLTAVILALALVMPHWAAALVVGLVFVLGGGAAIYFGVRRLGQFRLVPERTVQSLKVSAQTLRDQFR